MTTERAVPFVYIRMIWDQHPANMPQPRIAGSRCFDIHYGPTDTHPAGRRGLVMAAAWAQLSQPGTLGMLVQDGDVVIDPDDYITMVRGIHADPKAVITAPVKLWRVEKAGWVWAHWRGEATQQLVADPDFFCFNFTYLPKDLILKCVKAGLRSWSFPVVDTHVARVARQAEIPVRVADCSPKHMNF